MVLLHYVTQYIIIEVGSSGCCSLQAPAGLDITGWQQHLGSCANARDLALGDEDHDDDDADAHDQRF